MERKWIAYSFILLAKLIVLAHVLVPHHHHLQQVCIERDHCHDEAHKEPHEEAHDTDHQHDGSSAAQCLLKQTMLLPHNQNRQEHTEPHCKVLDPRLLHFVFFGRLADVCVPASKSTTTGIDPPPLYSLVLISSLGLRAPPVA